MRTFTIKNYKSLSSGAFTATLYRDNKRIALIEDDGHGGAPRLHLLAESGKLPETREDVRALWERQAEVVAEMDEWAKVTVPDWYLSNWGEWDDPLTANWELGIGYLTEVLEFVKLAKKGTLLRNPEGQFLTTRTVGAPPPTNFKGWVWVDGTWKPVG